MDAMESAVTDLQRRASRYDDLLHEDTVQRHKLKERLKTQEQQLQVNLDAVLSYKARQQEQQLLIEQLFDIVQSLQHQLESQGEKKVSASTPPAVEAPGGPVSPPNSTPPSELSHAEPMQADATRLSESVQPDLTLGGPTNTDPTTVDPTGVDPTGMDPTGVDPTGVDPTDVDPTGVDPTGADSTSMDRTTPDPTTPGQNSSGLTGADPSGGETLTGELDVGGCD
ncbi:hypothetical protein K474DRAFT_1677757 [Panus rudis PR-1116 ss-1]|nr:hypothetical protein K474DRAFT_1677757 [Panus rudis PR-1116 ss-1]